jgi:hypothetical protein
VVVVLAVSVAALVALLAATVWAAWCFWKRWRLSRRAMRDLRTTYRFRIARAVERERDRQSSPGAPPPMVLRSGDASKHDTLMRPPPLPKADWSDDDDRTEPSIYTTKTRVLRRPPPKK